MAGYFIFYFVVIFSKLSIDSPLFKSSSTEADVDTVIPAMYSWALLWVICMKKTKPRHLHSLTTNPDTLIFCATSP